MALPLSQESLAALKNPPADEPFLRSWVMNTKYCSVDFRLQLIQEWEQYEKTGKIKEESSLYQFALMLRKNIHSSIARLSYMRDISMECYRAMALHYMDERNKYKKIANELTPKKHGPINYDDIQQELDRQREKNNGPAAPPAAPIKINNGHSHVVIEGGKAKKN